MANQHGGARPGAGRPSKAEKYAGPIVAAEDKIADKLPEVVDAMVASAKEGDTKAGIYLLDRIMGKVPQALEHSGPEGASIPFDLKVLPGDELDALKRIVDRMAGLKSLEGPGGDRG